MNIGLILLEKNEGNIGGVKFLIDPDSQAQIQSSFKDCHFTVLGFTAANGQPILCMIILACKVLKMEQEKGRVLPWFHGREVGHPLACTSCLEGIFCNSGKQQKINCRERLSPSQLGFVRSPWINKISRHHQWSSSSLPASWHDRGCTNQPIRTQHRQWTCRNSHGETNQPKMSWEGQRSWLPQQCQFTCQLCPPKDAGCIKTHGGGLHVSRTSQTWNNCPCKSSIVCQIKVTEGSWSSSKETKWGRKVESEGVSGASKGQSELESAWSQDNGELV